MRDIRFLLKTHYGTSYALVIGINQYLEASPLEYAVNDARGIRDVLVDEFGFSDENVIFLADEEASKQAILRCFLRFTKGHIDIDDRLIVFFAGHGYTLLGNRGEVGFLMPHDAKLADVSSFIRWDELTRNSELIRAKHILFIMDACYGGLALTRHVQAGGVRFLKDMMLRHSRQVLTAGKANEVVADAGGPLPGHSIFAGHLIEALRGKAATDGDIITATGVMAYVYNKVATDKNSNQTPHYGHFEGDGDLVFKAPSLTELEDSEKRDKDLLIALPFFDAQSEVESKTVKVRRVKNLLSSDAGSIELHDVMMAEVRRFLSLTSEDYFATNGRFSQEEFLSRMAKYEDAVADLSILLACTAHWGRATHINVLQKCIARSCDRLESRAGLDAWLAMRWYPLVIELYCAGIAAVDAQRFDLLASIFYAPVPGFEDYGREEVFLELISEGLLKLIERDLVKKIPGHERHYTPLSEYLFKTLQPQLDDILFLGKGYDRVFDQFEVLFGLAVADIRRARDLTIWSPIGRFGWKQGARGITNGPLSRLIAEGRLMKDAWPPLRAGLFGGRFDRFDAVATEYLAWIQRLNWF